MAPCLQGQHRPSAQVRVTWRFVAPDSTAMMTPRRSSFSAASTQLRCLHDDFDAALGSAASPGVYSATAVRAAAPIPFSVNFRAILSVKSSCRHPSCVDATKDELGRGVI